MQTLLQSLTALCWHIHDCQTLPLLAALIKTAMLFCRAGIAISLCKTCEQAHARSRQLLEEKEDLCAEVHILTTSSLFASQSSSREAFACFDELPSHAVSSCHRVIFSNLESVVYLQLTAEKEKASKLYRKLQELQPGGEHQ